MTQIQPYDIKHDETTSETYSAETDEKEKLMTKKPIPCMRCISMRVFITLLIVLLLLTCSISIWLASFVGSTNALQQMTKELIGKVGEKTISYIQSEIEPQMRLSMSLAADVSFGVIGEKPKLVYLYEKYKIFKSSGVGVFYPTEMYTYSLTGIAPNTLLTYLEKQNDGIIFWNVNETNGNPTTMYKNDSTTYQITSQQYWKRSMELFNELSLNSIVGEPYLVVNSGLAIYCSTKIYNSTQYAINGEKQFIGIAKSNLLLNSIQEYLQNLTIIGNGYVILAEMSDNVIGASINSTSIDGQSRVSLFELIDKDSGQLMKDIRSQYGNLARMPSFIEIYSNGIGYDVSKIDYRYKNIHWILYMVVYKSDVDQTTNINSGVSVGVAVVVILFGVACSFLIGHLVTSPLRFLENQFMRIKTFDLKSCCFNSSKFKEVDSIYEHLFDMVTWLNEFKSFLPENVFNQLKNFEQVEWKSSLFEKKESFSRNSSGLGSSKVAKSNALQTSSSSSLKTSKVISGSLFKLGLNYSRCSVVNVKLFGYNEEVSTHELSTIFSKIANGLSTLCKTMQVSDLHIHGIDEYQLTFVDSNKKCEMASIESSLKISKILDNILGKSEKKVSYCIGVFTDMAYIGNIGNHSLRCYSVVGPIVCNARKLAVFGQTLDCKVLVDSGTLSPSIISQFVIRPVDRIEMEVFNSKTKHIISVHEVLRENLVNPDEWLYELEQSNSNSKFKDLQNSFVSIFEVETEEANFVEKVRETRRIFQRYIDENPSDTLVFNRLIYVLNFLLDYSDDSNASLFELFKNYKTAIHRSIQTLSHLNCVNVEITHVNFKG